MGSLGRGELTDGRSELSLCLLPVAAQGDHDDGSVPPSVVVEPGIGWRPQRALLRQLSSEPVFRGARGFF